MNRSAAALFVALSLTPQLAQAAEPTLPEVLRDIRGKKIDIAATARSGKLFVITVKATWCPVCRAQLNRIQQQLPRLESCDATFLVLAPGPRSKIEALAGESGFPFPFVEDRDLALADRLNLRLAEDQITPAILAIGPDRTIAWQQRGRSGLYFGDPELLEYLDCPDLRIASLN